MHINDLWNSGRASARLARLALIPASGLYALGWEIYLGMYRLGFKKAARPHSPVICVGNLVSGGAGKSPLTLHLAQVLREMGYEVVIGLSGYGAPHAEAAAIAPDGPLNAAEWGDEPAMTRWLMPEIPVVVGRRRVLAAQLVHERYPNAVLLMDDGFQHLPLAKTLTFVLDEPKPKNPFCLPAGPYREGRWNRRRADTVVPGQFHVEAEPLRLATPEGTPKPAPAEYALLCALGQPERFVTSVELLTGQPPRAKSLLPDHDRLDAGTLLEALPSELPVIVTAKDWVKLRERTDVGRREWLVARHEVRLEPAQELRRWLRDKLNGQTA